MLKLSFHSDSRPCAPDLHNDPRPRVSLIRATTDTLPVRRAIHRAGRSCSTRSLQGHARNGRAASATHHCPIGVPLAPPARTSRAAIHRLQPATQHYGQPNSSPTGTTTHTPHSSPHNHQSIPSPVPAHTPPPTPNRPTPQPHSTLVRTGRFGPPDRIQPQTTGSKLATC
jgi:hypothetical protein